MELQRRDWGRLRADELATWALAGRTEAWDEITRRYSHRVVVSLLARGMRLDVAEDLTQEVWMRLVQQQRAGRLRVLRLPGLAIAQAGWLAKEANRTSARRSAIAGTQVSLQAEPRAFEVVDPAMDPEQRAAHRERMETIEKELRRCPRRAQQIFRAVYGPDARAHADLARDLGMSVQRLRQTLCEVRARLRRALDELEKENGTWNTCPKASWKHMCSASQGHKMSTQFAGTS